MSGEWAASVKSNIGQCVKEEGEHSTPIFINIESYKTAVAAAPQKQPLFFEHFVRRRGKGAAVATTTATTTTELLAPFYIYFWETRSRDDFFPSFTGVPWSPEILAEP